MRLILLFLFPVFLFSQGGKDSIAVKYANTISKTDLKKHLYTIAGDDYEGRETGMDGQKKAATYLASEFNSYGIGPLNGSYFQRFPLVLSYAHGVSIKNQDSSYKWMRDFFYTSNFINTEVETSELLYLGYGIADEKYNDYSGVDVKGKIILINEGEPFKKGKSLITEDFKVSKWSEGFKEKLKVATDKGVSAILIISDKIKYVVGNEAYRHYLEEPKMMLKSEFEKNKLIPVIYISKEMANSLLRGDKNSDFIDKTVKKINKTGKPRSKSFTDLKKIHLKVNKQYDELSSENVLAFIEGTDLKNEVVIITAHYDHIGVDGELIYNGADDDGSGTVALLEIAQAFQEAKKAGHGPRRSILIMPVSGEEKGLLGSKYYSENPLFPLEYTVANLNIDMIGRVDDAHEGNPDYIYLIGSDILSQDLHDISENANATYTNLKLDYTYNDLNDPNKFYYRSDHYNFAKNNIPVIFYFNGVHEDYHKATDTVEKIDFDKMEVITRLVFFTAWDLVNREERIQLN